MQSYLISYQVDSVPFDVYYVNDFSPEFVPISGQYNASLSEDVQNGTYAAKVTAFDKDSGSQGEVSYSIVGGNIGNMFSIDAISGNISTAAELDRETTSSFNLIIRASDGAVAEKIRYTEGVVKVDISDINDNPPAFSSSLFTAKVPEDAAISDVIVALQATDPDEGTNSDIHYSILSGNDAGLFVINNTIGNIMVNTSLDLEQGTPPILNHTLVVFAKDLGTPVSLNTSAELNINISPVNEFTPQLLHDLKFNFSFPENAGVGDGVFVVEVNATDQDYGEQGEISYIIFSGEKLSVIYLI